MEKELGEKKERNRQWAASPEFGPAQPMIPF
jgi:hypothetical protein